jgi:hypothetical protein
LPAKQHGGELYVTEKGRDDLVLIMSGPQA